MIKINDRFSISHDGIGWQLHESKTRIDSKTGELVEFVHTTYPGRLWVALARIIEKCGDEAGDVKQLREIILATIIDFKRATLGEKRR